MAQFHEAPDRYLALMRSALPLYDQLQDELVHATVGVHAKRILDLGAGTGETSRRCVQAHPQAHVVAVDASAEMLRLAAAALNERGETRLAQLEDDLPDGQFDLIVSALAVHHLDGTGKADLFRRVHAALAPRGRFVMADVVIPDEPVAQPTPIDPRIDKPSPLPALLEWLAESGLPAIVSWAAHDLAVVAASRPANPTTQARLR